MFNSFSRKIRVLVFPCGSEIGLEIYKALNYSRFFELIGASSCNDHGEFVYEDYIGGVPHIDDADFIEKFAKVIKEREIDVVYPTMDIVITKLKAHQEELGCLVIGSTLETTEICLSKRKTYEHLKDIIRTPQIYNADGISTFPIFVKPSIGASSNGAHIIRNIEELIAYTHDNTDDFLILEYLPGKEYTVDCFSNHKGELLYYAARIRNRVKAGICVNTCFAEEQDEFEEPIRKINDALHFCGAWFVQFKRDKNGELCLLEIASRLGGASTLSRAIGVNFPLLCLYDAYGYDVSISPNKYEVVLDRAFTNVIRNNLMFDTVYVDYDDCLIMNDNKINIDLVTFLYNCINKGKRIVLISKHEGDLVSELKKYKLYQIFDEVLHIDKNQNKMDYIKDKRSIYIDDSFSERESIKDKLNIPVLSPDMVGMMKI